MSASTPSRQAECSTMNFIPNPSTQGAERRGDSQGNTVSSARAAKVRPLVRVVIVGHVDHGKSTLIGRLLHETGSIPDGKLETLKAVSSRHGKSLEWSFLLDALQTERKQGITLDTSQIRFRAPSRDVVLIDAPGHAEFLRNMITGAAQADAALLLIDASEGVRDQTRRHGYLLHLLGISQVAVVINKMDLVGFDERRFREIEADIVGRLSQFGLSATALVPISARHGDGVATRTASIGWYGGPTVLEVLDRFTTAKPLADLPLRMPVQAVYKFDDRRIVAGRIETGRVAVGDAVLVMPRGTRAQVQSIEAWPAPVAAAKPQAASAGRSVGLVLDSEVFIDRGDVIAVTEAPPKAATRLRARIFWLDGTPLKAGDVVNARVGTADCAATVALVEHAVDPADITADGGSIIEQNRVGEIEIALTNPMAVDLHALNPRTGRLVLDREGRISGGGLILAIDGKSRQGGETDQTGQDDEARPTPADVVSEGRPGRVHDQASHLSTLLNGLAPAARIARFRDEVEGKLVFTTSFGLEDQVILHFIAERGVDIAVVTLDTGRLFPETYDLWAETERRYGLRIRAFSPRPAGVEEFVARHGINGFYDSHEGRLACCHVRKVEPLNRALEGAAGWIVGLRADQSGDRRGTAVVSVDQRGLLKLSPIFDWTRDDVQSFATANQVPINRLHAKRYLSIGCAPCTRAVAPGESERDGRWWWENEGKKECGLHIDPPKHGGGD
jgi:sulfate adenylyltransferase large subunit/phosphoadenylyl-sulfate reductase (thioredoxin)